MLNELQDKQNVFICCQTQQYLVFRILMAMCFDFSDHHMAILRKRDLRYMQCNHLVWDTIILTVVSIVIIVGYNIIYEVVNQ